MTGEQDHAKRMSPSRPRQIDLPLAEVRRHVEAGNEGGSRTLEGAGARTRRVKRYAHRIRNLCKAPGWELRIVDARIADCSNAIPMCA
jgi:hypothetical protein